MSMNETIQTAFGNGDPETLSLTKSGAIEIHFIFPVSVCEWPKSNTWLRRSFF